MELFLNGGDTRLKIHGGLRKGVVRVFKDRHAFGIDSHCVGRFSHEKIGNLLFRNRTYHISIGILYSVLMKNPGERGDGDYKDACDKNRKTPISFHEVLPNAGTEAHIATANRIAIPDINVFFILKTSLIYYK